MGDNSSKWSQRRLRHCKHYGIKSDVASEKLRSAVLLEDTTPDGDSRPSKFDGLSTARSTAAISRTRSMDRTSPDRDSFVEKRESVFQMACKGFNSILNGDFFRQIHHGRTSSRVRNRAQTINRVPTYISVRDKDRTLIGYSSFPSSSSNRANNYHHHHRSSRCEATPSANGNGLLEAGEESTRTRSGTAGQHSSEFEQPTSTNFYLHSQDPLEQMDLDDDDIFDVLFFEQQPQKNGEPPTKTDHYPMNGTNHKSAGTASLHRVTPQLDAVKVDHLQISKKRSKLQKIVDVFGPASEDSVNRLRSLAKFNFSIRRGHADEGEDGAEEPARNMPMYGRFDPELIKKLKDGSCDYRPYFTYWISTVHTLVLLFMLLNYGIGTNLSSMVFNPFGVIERSGDVMTSSLSLAHIVVWEQNNMWIGPKYADLVHAGAKYTPCMRKDAKIYDQIWQERWMEADKTGCCIGPWGCYQTSECPKQFAQLLKWVNGSFPESDYSRVVCGQDPRYCVRPRSMHPLLWDLNISNWPICEQKSRRIPLSVRHMHCDVTGRPCCIQMHGQCRITSEAYCDFVGGSYHPNATLCSQVSCLGEVCGMTPFMRRDHPDQIFRLITPLFIQAGIIRCLISLAMYLTIMRRFEIMIGWLRLSTIYFVSGIGGYLASAVFVPYMPEVGPAGSEGGILGALIVNIVYNWDLLSQPYRALLIHVAIAGMLFILGFLPWIDNWAQVFGFIFGSLMAIVLIPYITIGKGRVRKRLPVVIGAVGITAALFGTLLLLFLFYPIDFEPLSLLNCPFSTKICDQQGLILRSWLPI